MFVNNFYRALSRTLCGYPAKSTIIRMNGEVGSWGTQPADYQFIRFGVSDTYGPYMGRCTHPTNPDSGVMFGNGTTQPTADDYTLSGEIFSAYTAAVTLNMTEDDTGVDIVGTYTISNTGDEDFVISEVALCGGTRTGSLSGHYLFERTLLDDPVTIPAGGIGQVTYTVRVNYPT